MSVFSFFRASRLTGGEEKMRTGGEDQLKLVKKASANEFMISTQVLTHNLVREYP